LLADFVFGFHGSHKIRESGLVAVRRTAYALL
jgi:hypothetical protein